MTTYTEQIKLWLTNSSYLSEECVAFDIICSTRLVVSLTTSESSGSSGKSKVIWADNLLYTELLSDFFLLDSSYLNCCLRNIEFFKLS